MVKTLTPIGKLQHQLLEDEKKLTQALLVATVNIKNS